MISILAQERLLGAALGSVFAGVIVFEQRKSLYRSISENYPPSTQSPMRKPVLAKKYGPEFSHLWNRAVDQTFGPVIQVLWGYTSYAKRSMGRYFNRFYRVIHLLTVNTFLKTISDKRIHVSKYHS